MPATVVLIKADTAVEGTDGVIRTHEVLVGAPQAARRHRRQRHHPGRGAVRLHGAADDPGHRIERRGARQAVEFRSGEQFGARVEFRTREQFGARTKFRSGEQFGAGIELRPREQFSTGIELRPRTKFRSGIEFRPRTELRSSEQFGAGIELRPRTELRYP